MKRKVCAFILVICLLFSICSLSYADENEKYFPLTYAEFINKFINFYSLEPDGGTYRLLGIRSSGNIYVHGQNSISGEYETDDSDIQMTGIFFSSSSGISGFRENDFTSLCKLGEPVAEIFGFDFSAEDFLKYADYDNSSFGSQYNWSHDGYHFKLESFMLLKNAYTYDFYIDKL